MLFRNIKNCFKRENNLSYCLEGKLLENRKFDSALLQFGDLSEVAKLFSLSDVIHSTDLDEIDKLVAYGIIPDSEDRTNNYSNSSHVYKNLRKHYK